MTDTTNLQKWIQELRTTDRPQGQNYLAKRDSTGQFAYCCLGVGCEVAGIKGKLHSSGNLRIFGMVDTLAPHDFIQWLGFDTEAISDNEVGPLPRCSGRRPPFGGRGPRASDTRPSLAGLNDLGFSFAEIADLIEEYGLRENSTGQTISL